MHLTKKGGVGTQRNPKYDDVKLLEDRRRIMDQDDDDDGREGGGDKCYPNVELDVSDTGDTTTPTTIYSWHG